MTVHDYVQRGDLKSAIKLLIAEGVDDAIPLSGQLSSLERENGLGLLDGSDYRITRNRICHSILQLAKPQNITVVNHGTVYITFLSKEDRPGNELALFNKVFRAFEQMLEDQDYPAAEIEQSLTAMHKYLDMSDYIEAWEVTGSKKYRDNTPAYQTKIRKEFLEYITANKNDFISAIRQAVTETQRQTTWREAWELLVKDPSKNRWDQTKLLIDDRLADGIFTNAQRQQWGDVSGDVDSIEAGMLWKIKFNRYLPDLKHWVGTNLR